jgi:hypothetical protein
MRVRRGADGKWDILGEDGMLLETGFISCDEAEWHMDKLSDDIEFWAKRAFNPTQEETHA